jgi:pilus assembly protein Flp/PilA
MLAGAMGYNQMKNFLNSFLRDESGASAAEYALILVVIGIAIVAGGLTLSGAIGDAMTDAASCIGDPSTNGTANVACAN